MSSSDDVDGTAVGQLDDGAVAHQGHRLPSSRWVLEVDLDGDSIGAASGPGDAPWLTAILHRRRPR
jgi:hypothetical protein